MSKSRKAASSTALLLVALFTLTSVGFTFSGGNALAENGGGPDPGLESQPDSLPDPDPMVQPTGVPSATYFWILVDAIF